DGLGAGPATGACRVGTGRRSRWAPAARTWSTWASLTRSPARTSRRSSSTCRASTIGSARARSPRSAWRRWWPPTASRRRPTTARPSATPRGTRVAWVELGRLGAPYGVKGWVHVESYTDPPERLLEHREWVLRLSSGARRLRGGGRGAG